MITDEITRLATLLGDKKNAKLKIIDEIEAVRKGYNVIWMDLLRLAFSSAPMEAKEIVRRINSDDNNISLLFEKLGK